MRIMPIKRTIRTWSNNKFKDLFLKALTSSKFRILLLSLFHSITVYPKKEFQKYSCLTLNKGMVLWFLIVRVDKTLRIISKGKRDSYFFKFEKQAQFSVQSPCF